MSKKVVVSKKKTDGIAPDEEPTPAETYRGKFVPIDPTAFLKSKGLWAVNYLVLWPLGLALTATSEGDEVIRLDVREWVYPGDELGETINQSRDENQADYEVFIGYVRDRLLAMKPEERALALDRYSGHGIATAEQIMLAKP